MVCVLQGPFLREEFLGCVDLQQGLYAVVTVGHLLLLACRTIPQAGAAAAAASSDSADSSTAGVPHSGQLQAAGQQPQQQYGAGSVQPSSNQQQQQQAKQQQRAVCVQYKDPQLVFVLDVRDVMMVAAEGSSLRLLCMAGDPAASAAAVSADTAAAAAAAEGVAHQTGVAQAAKAGNDDTGGGNSGWEGDVGIEGGLEGGGGVSSGGAGAAKGGEGVMGDASLGASSSGLRELLSVAGLSGAGAGAGSGLGKTGAATAGLQQLPSPPEGAVSSPSVPTAAGVQAGAVARWPAAGSRVATITHAELEAAAAGAAAAVAAAVGGGLMGLSWGLEPARSRAAADGEGGSAASAAQEGGGWGGCKWFVGHQVPCGSEQAALELQRLLERACQRVETLLASSAWPRQLML
jgi:hypothetical protein